MIKIEIGIEDIASCVALGIVVYLVLTITGCSIKETELSMQLKAQQYQQELTQKDK